MAHPVQQLKQVQAPRGGQIGHTKASMKFDFEKAQMNVVPLFGGTSTEIIPDPLETLLLETEIILSEEKKLAGPSLPVVTAQQFPDQSMFVLDQQLSHLKESVNRIKFYLLDLDDLLPK